MKEHKTFLEFLFTLSKTEAILARTLDRGLGGIGLYEFIILYKLSLAPKQTLSRTELADILGLTASGITRLLLPMEKVGLIERQASKEDARVSNVSLASGGRKKLELAEEKIEYFIQEKMQLKKAEPINDLTKFLDQICTFCK